MFFGSVEKPPRLSAFDLEVPENLIADKPSKMRENSKLMVLNRKDMSIEHKKFKDIVSYFKKGEVLVLNNTKGEFTAGETITAPTNSRTGTIQFNAFGCKGFEQKEFNQTKNIIIITSIL